MLLILIIFNFVIYIIIEEIKYIKQIMKKSYYKFKI